MAAVYMTATRTVLQGVRLAPGRWLLNESSQTPSGYQCLRVEAARCRRLHVSAAAPQSSSRTEPQGPEYIPKTKAKNPMMSVFYAWMIGFPTGIIGFFLVKREVDKNRLKQLKVRQRMRRSNEEEYERSRYHHHREDVKLDQ